MLQIVLFISHFPLQANRALTISCWFMLPGRLPKAT